MTTETSTIERGRAGREAILDGVARVLVRDRRSVVEMQDVIASSGFSFAEVSAEFEDTDDVLLSLVGRVSAGICEPLKGVPPGPEPGARDVEAALLGFGNRLHEACSSVLVGIFRVFVTESGRRKDLARAFHDAGPGAMRAALRTFLERAVDAGELAMERPDLAAGHLIGLLREPLYRELAVHGPDLPHADDPDRWIREAIRMFLHGCAAPGARS